MRVIVAMSGGVDSSVAAALLKEQGHEVIGVTLKLVTSAGNPAVRQAEEVAGLLGMAHHVLDHRDEFEQSVLSHCWSEYAKGRTPNPCVLCNPGFKLASLLGLADDLQAERVATGHHARIHPGGREQSPVLLRGRDPDKDQSYFLSRLSPEQLKRIWLPVGEFTKAEVRTKAASLDLPCADQPDSQDACFAQGGVGFAEELRKRFDAPCVAGDIVDLQGRRLGQHLGLHRFTVGQRRGLGVALGKRVWVKAICAESGRVIVTWDKNQLLSDGLLATDVVFHPRHAGRLTGRAEVQVRSRHLAAGASFRQLADARVQVSFDEPQRAVTPGQAAVLYTGQEVMGCGWIAQTCSGSPEDPHANR